MVKGLALHTWTLDTTPLPELLRIAREAGWDAVELRRLDFARAAEAGRPAAQVLDMVRASGLAVACVGVELGWMAAEGAERERLFRNFAESCGWAASLDCGTVMSPADRGRGSLPRVVENVRAAGDLAARHGVRLALEFNSQAEQWNSLGAVREVLQRAGHPHCGLLLDAYHLCRSGGRPQDIRALAPAEIAYVQYSDVPKDGGEPGVLTNRLPPGQGMVPLAEFFQVVEERGYRGYLSYEAPNPSTWSRDPAGVAREALLATRALLPRG